MQILWILQSYKSKLNLYWTRFTLKLIKSNIRETLKILRNNSRISSKSSLLSTQTEGASLSSEENKFVKPLPPQNSNEGMSAKELRLLDCERQIEQLEIQNAQMLFCVIFWVILSLANFFP
ncbi:unnamed protein product [Meloidogyne enterolobii]|uniref:Uncharacterized protein n=1 Tax=Meloidogyne enterolobii TaxID=390850 RepID=A0ACB0YXI8_MELEN